MKKIMSADELNERAKKRVIMICIVGLLFVISDFIVSTRESVEIVKSKGQTYMVRPEKDEANAHTSFRASIEGKDKNIEKKVDVSLEPYGKNKKTAPKKEEQKNVMSEQERLEYELKSVVNDFNENKQDKKVLLPSKLESGERISWESTSTTNGAVIIMCTMLFIAAVYKTRLSPLEKQRKQEQESIIRQLPEFVNKLVLLLNAGLVLNSAFERAIEESLKFKSGEADYFSQKLQSGYKTVKTTNGSINKEFRSFARESGAKELMRISNIINDNIDKGVELTDKLRRESEILWLNRKKNCEEKGRLAETKLTLPLVIFLMVLVVITIAPAMLEL